MITPNNSNSKTSRSYEDYYATPIPKKAKITSDEQHAEQANSSTQDIASDLLNDENLNPKKRCTEAAKEINQIAQKVHSEQQVGTTTATQPESKQTVTAGRPATRNSLNRTSSVVTNQTQPAGKPKRTVVSNDKNVASSLALEPEVFFDTIQSESEIKNHAFLRVMMFALQATVLSGVAKGTNPGDVREINMDLGRAFLQVGKGRGFFQAAHRHTMAGYKDNWREDAIQRISSQQTITPKTLDILKCKGFTDAAINTLLANCYAADKVGEVFDKMWPVNDERTHSLLSGTRLELTLNSTTVVPATVNVFTDKSVEDAIRPRTLDLLNRVARGEMRREEACTYYCQMIWDHFNSLEPEIERRQGCLRDYFDNLQALVKSSSVNDQDVGNCVTRLVVIHDNMQSAHPAFKYSRMKKNEQFLAAVGGQDFNVTKMETVRTWIRTRGEELLDETVKYGSRLANYLKYSIWEREGTAIPDYTTLFGNEDEILLQQRMLQPVTPFKLTGQPDNKAIVASRFRVLGDNI